MKNLFPRPVHPGKDDTRSVGELITCALGDPEYDRDGWDAVVALHWRGTEEVLERATMLTRSFCAAERRVGADILGQLGMPCTFPTHCVSILLKMLRCESDANVTYAILIALGHLGEPEAIKPASRLCRHPHARVRYGVVHALTGYDDPTAIRALIELSKDEDDLVRDWATFALGQQIDTDSPALREALVERLSDSDFDARGEALIGLARRGDRRVIPALVVELESGRVGTLAVESARMFADPQFFSALIALKEWWDVDVELLNDAIQACAPKERI